MTVMVDPDSVRFPNPDPLFDAIGRVAYAWSNLESELGRVLAAVLQAPLAKALISGQAYAIVHGHLEALMQYGVGKYRHETPIPMDDDHRERLKAELAVVKALSVRRNQIVHGLWLPQPGHNDEHRYNLRPQRHRQMMPLEPISIEEMLAVAKEIEAAAKRLGLIGASIDHEAYGLINPPDFGESEW